MYRAFPQKEYAQRAQIETIFSVIQRKLSSRAPRPQLARANPPSPAPRAHL
jgi:hypothetical protein